MSEPIIHYVQPRRRIGQYSKRVRLQAGLKELNIDTGSIHLLVLR